MKPKVVEGNILKLSVFYTITASTVNISHWNNHLSSLATPVNNINFNSACKVRLSATFHSEVEQFYMYILAVTLKNLSTYPSQGISQ